MSEPLSKMKMAPNDDPLSEIFGQQKPSEKKEEEERPSWRDNPLHRKYQPQIKWLILGKHTSGLRRLVSGSAQSD